MEVCNTSAFPSCLVLHVRSTEKKTYSQKMCNMYNVTKPEALPIAFINASAFSSCLELHVRVALNHPQ